MFLIIIQFILFLCTFLFIYLFTFILTFLYIEHFQTKYQYKLEAWELKPLPFVILTMLLFNKWKSYLKSLGRCRFSESMGRMKMMMKMIIIKYWNLSISQNLHLQMLIMKIIRVYYTTVTVNINAFYVLIWNLNLVFTAVYPIENMWLNVITNTSRP